MSSGSSPNDNADRQRDAPRGRPGRPRASTMSAPGGQDDRDARSGKRKPSRGFATSDRASHAVTEKQRKEALTALFVDLARLTPALASARRLSKTSILTEATTHARRQRAERLVCAKELRRMLAVQDSLVAELRVLRSQLHPVDNATMQQRELGVGLTPEAQAVITSVEGETFGSFPNGFGDNWDEAAEQMVEEVEDRDERESAKNTLASHRRRLASRSMSTAGSETAGRAHSVSTSGTPPATDIAGPSSTRLPLYNDERLDLAGFPGHGIEVGGVNSFVDERTDLGGSPSLYFDLSSPHTGTHPSASYFAQEEHPFAARMDVISPPLAFPSQPVLAAGSSFAALSLQNQPRGLSHAAPESQNPLGLSQDEWARYLQVSSSPPTSLTASGSSASLTQTQALAAGVGSGRPPALAFPVDVELPSRVNVAAPGDGFAPWMQMDYSPPVPLSDPHGHSPVIVPNSHPWWLRRLKAAKSKCVFEYLYTFAPLPFAASTGILD
uniref:BHLH domain-containing protein n=1 Tax=Mycena chlorophos TaxID=658473 RepID=A0ABQ0KWI2_MYCCL|nr:predicted protein [Mycena chlorophos]